MLISARLCVQAPKCLDTVLSAVAQQGIGCAKVAVLAAKRTVLESPDQQEPEAVYFDLQARHLICEAYLHLWGLFYCFPFGTCTDRFG